MIPPTSRDVFFLVKNILITFFNYLGHWKWIKRELEWVFKVTKQLLDQTAFSDWLSNILQSGKMCFFMLSLVFKKKKIRRSNTHKNRFCTNHLPKVYFEANASNMLKC